MKPNVDTLAAISAGYRRGAGRLEELRRSDIRKSEAMTAIPAFDGVFRLALEKAAPRIPVPLTKAQRVLFGIDT